MRSLVFLPPPTLSQLGPSNGRTSFTIPLAGPSSRRPVDVLADETRPVEIVPDSVDPHHHSLAEGDDLTAQSETLPPVRVLADETRPISEIVPDSVDPHHPSSQEESIARSELDAPMAVPWEVLHAEKGCDAGRAKRVRIRSPVLVIETPERRNQTARVRDGMGRARKSRLSAESVVVTSMEEDEGDKSRVVLGEGSESEEDVLDQVDESNISNASHGMITPRRVINDTFASTPQVPAPSRRFTNDDTFEPTSQSSVHPQDDTTYPPQDPGQSPHIDLSLLAAVPAVPVLATTSTPEAERPSSIPIPTAAEASLQASQSASSLQIRPPIPAAAGAPQATCRFTFFSKRPRASASMLQGSTQPSIRPPATHDEPSIAAAPHPAPTADANSSIRATLPIMNAVTASYDTLSTDASVQQSHSIVPPPTLHFSLGGVTPVGRILANPSHFLGPSTAVGAVGGVSGRVNLLVVVKEVGVGSRVRCKFPVDSPSRAVVGNGGRGEVRAQSRAFLEAASTTTGDGKTDRFELLVMEGRLSPTRRFLCESSSPTIVDEISEKSLFTIILWGALARSWTTPSPTPHPTSTLTPTPLQPGDVVSLTNLSLTRITASPVKRRLGPGHPQPPAQGRTGVVAHASHANHTVVELCYRSQAHTSADRERNFDAEVARFDLRSRRVLELARLWSASM